MKRILAFVLILFCLLPLKTSAEGYSDDFRNSVDLEDSLLSEDTDLNDPHSVEKDLSASHWWSYFLKQFKKALSDALGCLSQGLSMVLLSVLVQRSGSNIQNQNLRFLFSFLVSLSVVLMCEGSLRTGAESLQRGIENMGVFTKACIPSLTVVMIASGEGGGAAVFSGAMVLLGELGVMISKNLLLPLTNVYLSIGICSAVNDEYNFASIGKNIRKFLIWVVGLLCLAFKTLLKLQTGAAAAGDQLTKKYIRSAVGAFIPMVGNTISNSIDGLFSVASGVKTSFAIGGVLIVLSILFPVLICLGVNGLSWSVCKWVADFLEDKTVRMVSDVLANCFYLMLALGGCVTLMGLFSFLGLMSQVG